jgi:DNA invertase Pin-like site-specific DNA recombinase
VTTYGYARVSTRDQDPQLQINALAAAGCDTIVKEHASGVAKRRPVLEQLLAQVKPGDQICVWKIDRWGRSITFLHRSIEELIERGVSFRSLTDPLNTTTPQGRLQLGILASVAAFERDLIKERTLASKALMKSQGRHTGGPALFGWERDHTTVNQTEAKLVREVAARVLQGEPLGRVVDQLNTRDDVPRPRRSDRWRVVSMRRVLENPTTAAIVGDDRHRELVMILGRNQGQGQGGGRPAEHLLSGILACSRCNQSMYSFPKVKDQSRELYYRCKPAQGSGGRFKGCGSMFIAEPRADTWAEEMFVSAVVSPSFSETLSRRQAELLAGDATTKELDAMREEIQELELVLPTRFSTEDMKRRHAQFRRLVDQATAQLMAAPELAQLLDLPRSEKKLRAAWASWSIAQRRDWLRRLVERIDVNPPTSRSRASDVESRFKPVWRI